MDLAAADAPPLWWYGQQACLADARQAHRQMQAMHLERPVLVAGNTCGAGTGWPPGECAKQRHCWSQCQPHLSSGDNRWADMAPGSRTPLRLPNDCARCRLWPGSSCGSAGWLLCMTGPLWPAGLLSRAPSPSLAGPLPPCPPAAAGSGCEPGCPSRLLLPCTPAVGFKPSCPRGTAGAVCSGSGLGPADCARGASCAARGGSEAAGSLSARALCSDAATERSETELMERRRLLRGCSW